MDASHRYRLIRLLERGGTAEVFEAVVEGPGRFQRRVAIKRLLEEHAREPAMLDSFADEANLVSRLHHANIVNVFDFGVMDGLPFQALELVDGGDLARLQASAAAASRAIPVEVALHVSAQVAHALDYAHRARGPDGEPLGIVHRDVSPENILISREADVKLADFGIARTFQRRAPTALGFARGKLPFMAPEYLRGEIADARADIFSLGCVLHQMLAGESPIAEESVRREVIAGGRARIDPQLDEDLRTIVARATEPDRTLRYPDAAAFARDCARAQAARAGGDGRSALRAFVEEVEDVERRTAVRAPQHPLEALMNVELVLQESSPGLRRFVSLTRASETKEERAEPTEASQHSERSEFSVFTEVSASARLQDPSAGPDAAVTEVERPPVNPSTEKTLGPTAIVVRPTPRIDPRVLFSLATVAVLFAVLAVISTLRRPTLEPIAISQPGAVARAAPPAEVEPAPEEAAPEEGTEGQREPTRARPTKKSAPAPASLDALEAPLSALLAARVLTRDELLELDATRDAAKRLQLARESHDDDSARRAYAELLPAVRAIPIDASAAQRRLARLRDRLSRAATKRAPETLVELEKRYLDLRSALSPAMSRESAERLIRDADALDRELASP